MSGEAWPGLEHSQEDASRMLFENTLLSSTIDSDYRPCMGLQASSCTIIEYLLIQLRYHSAG